MSEGADERVRSFAEMTAGLAMQEAFYRQSSVPGYLVKQDMGAVNFLQFFINQDTFTFNENTVPDHRALYTFICLFDDVDREAIERLSQQQRRGQELGILTDFVVVDLKAGTLNNLARGRMTDRKLQAVIEKALGYRDAESAEMQQIKREAVQKAREGHKAAATVRTLSLSSPVMILIFINIAIYVAGVVLSVFLGTDPLQNWGILDSDLVYRGQLWRLFTAMFLHADMAHIFGNMYLLLMLGRVLSGQYSNKRFLGVYLVSGVFGSLLSCLFTHARSLGASGAIMGLGGALVCKLLFDKNRLYLRQGALYANLAFLVIFNLGYGLFNTGIDNYGHFGGFFCGFLLELIFSRKRA